MSKEIINGMNPFIKLILLTIVTLIVSFEFNPYLPAMLILLLLIIVKGFSNLSVLELIKSVRMFWLMSILFMGFIVLMRIISGVDLMLLRVLGLGLKIMAISIYSAVFIKTTNSTELVISIVRYGKVSPKYAYAFLTAYRFLPTFKEELEIIKHAQEVRGIRNGNNIFNDIIDIKKYVIPMMSTAVRKGVRISMAMEARGFGKYEKRTYYREVNIDNRDCIYALIYIVIVLVLIVVLNNFGLINMGLKFLGRLG